MASQIKSEAVSAGSGNNNDDVLDDCYQAYRELGKAKLSLDRERILKAEARWQEASQQYAQ